MQHQPKLDAILSAIARVGSPGMADRLLDFRASAHFPDAAGRCVKIYFDLLGEAPLSGVLDGPLADLREWLEERLSIEVVDETRKERVERLPLRFRGESDLEDFCRGAMRDYRLDRCPAHGPLRMQFGLNERLGHSASPA